jgi:hypothetical protein
MRTKRKRTIRKKKKSNSLEILEKAANRNFLQGVTIADFVTEKMDDTDVNEGKCFLLSLLLSFRQFNDKQNLAQMEILKIM